MLRAGIADSASFKLCAGVGITSKSTPTQAFMGTPPQNVIFKTNCTTRYASPFDTIAVEVEVLWVWQHAVPKFDDKMLVDPTLVDPSFRKFA